MIVKISTYQVSFLVTSYLFLLYFICAMNNSFASLINNTAMHLIICECCEYSLSMTWTPMNVGSWNVRNRFSIPQQGWNLPASAYLASQGRDCRRSNLFNTNDWYCICFPSRQELEYSLWFDIFRSANYFVRKWIILQWIRLIRI